MKIFFRYYNNGIGNRAAAAQWLALLPHSKKVLDSNLAEALLNIYVHILPIPVWLFSGYFSILTHANDVHVRLIGNCTLAIV